MSQVFDMPVSKPGFAPSLAKSVFPIRYSTWEMNKLKLPETALAIRL